MSTHQSAPARGEAPMPATREGRTNRLTTRTNGNTNGDARKNGRAPKLSPQAAVRGRWEGIVRPYSEEDVERLRGTVRVEHTLARMGATRLWDLVTKQDYVAALGALPGNQAVQQGKAGLQAIYLSGWQVAADANLAGQTYPDQSLYPANSVPSVVRRINQALLRADQIENSESRKGVQEGARSNGHRNGHENGNGRANGNGQANGQPADKRYWLAPIVADAEAGFGGPLNAFELMRAMIEAGAAAVHFEDQLSSEKKCGHLGGKVLIPTSHFVRTLIAARLAADVLDVPTVLIARTDANSAKLLTSDVDPRDQPFIEGARTSEGFYRVKGGIEAACARGLAYAPYAD